MFWISAPPRSTFCSSSFTFAASCSFCSLISLFLPVFLICATALPMVPWDWLHTAQNAPCPFPWGLNLSLSRALIPTLKPDELLSFEIVLYFTKHHCEEAQFTIRTNKTRNKREMIYGNNFYLKNKTFIKKEIKIDKLDIWL